MKLKIGFIADGNRRWAKQRGLSPAKGHEAGFRAVSDHVLPFCYDRDDINALAVYAFSTENWKRSPLELKSLFRLYHEMIDGWRDEFMKKRIRLVWAGRRTKIMRSLRTKIEELETVSSKNRKFTVYLCLDYGSHDEIFQSIEHIEKTAFQNTKKMEKSFLENLKVPSLDIIIRSGGEMRLSNFCLWQAAYAEFFFEPEYLPDFTKKKMESILNRFYNRDRRTGK